MGRVDKVLMKKLVKAERERLYGHRHSKSIPVKQWWVEERKKIIEKNMRKEILEMYRKSVCFDGYNKHFTGFCQLDEDFKI